MITFVKLIIFTDLTGGLRKHCAGNFVWFSTYCWRKKYNVKPYSSYFSVITGMFLNPPYKYACKSCKSHPCFKKHSELKEHFQIVHGMHELPPAPSSWYANTWRKIENTSTSATSMGLNPIRSLERGRLTVPDLTERVKNDLEQNLNVLLDRHIPKCTAKERLELLQNVNQIVPVLVKAFARDLESDLQRGMNGPSSITLDKHYSRVNASIIQKMPANVCFAALF